MESARPRISRQDRRSHDIAAVLAGMEATLFTGWIYDHLVSGGTMVKVAHPAMLQAIAAGKKKNDRVDARKIADLLRCATTSRNATWRRGKFGTAGGCCAIAICW